MLFCVLAGILGAPGCATAPRPVRSGDAPTRDPRVARAVLEARGVDPAECAAETMFAEPLDTVVSEVDLDGDGTREELALGPRCECAPVGNCSFTILARHGSGFRSLLAEYGIAMFSVRRTRTSGFLDIEVVSHVSAFESVHRVLRYDGTKYVTSECANWSYADVDADAVGNAKQPPQPRITSCATPTEAR